MTRIRDIIQDVYDLLEEEENWCQGALARNSEGQPCATDDDDAQRWDFLGALQRSLERNNATKDEQGAVGRILMHAIQMKGHWKMGYSRVNDELGHAAVLAVLEYALEHRK